MVKSKERNSSWVSKEAVKAVMKYERQHGRKPNELKLGEGYDVLSSGRRIEVKGRGDETPPHIFMNAYNIAAFEKEKNWHLYVVSGVKTKPNVIPFSRNQVKERKKKIVQWKIPLRKADLKRGKKIG